MIVYYFYLWYSYVFLTQHQLCLAFLITSSDFSATQQNFPPFGLLHFYFIKQRNTDWCWQILWSSCVMDAERSGSDIQVQDLRMIMWQIAVLLSYWDQLSQVSGAFGPQRELLRSINSQLNHPLSPTPSYQFCLWPDQPPASAHMAPHYVGQQSQKIIVSLFWLLCMLCGSIITINIII